MPKRLIFLFSTIMTLAFTFNSWASLVEEGKRLKEQKYKEAFLKFQKACDWGYAKGCVNLGVMYEDGQGVKQDYSKAKELFGKACDMKLQLGCDAYKLLNEKEY